MCVLRLCVCLLRLYFSWQALFANNGVACVWLLQTLLSDQASLKRLRFETEDEPTRNALAKLLSQARCVLWLCTSRCASCPSEPCRLSSLLTSRPAPYVHTPRFHALC